MARLSKIRLPVKNGDDVELIEYSLPTYSPVTLGFGYGTCSTAYITTAKTVSISSYTLTKFGIVSVTFNNAVPSNSTLNVNSKGAKPIYHRGAPLKNNVIYAGDTATFIYDGAHYNLIALDRVPTVNNDTVIL